MTGTSAVFIGPRCAVLALAVFVIGCGAQASGQYLGEPLLSMRGQVSIANLTGAGQSIPALCFQQFFLDKLVKLAPLPASVRADFENAGLSGDGSESRIVDVETRGTFPAQFNVDVYSPPPSAAISPLFAGEPGSAFGVVCAVSQDHAALEQDLTDVGQSACAIEPTGLACTGTMLRIKHDGSRFYSEHSICPAGAQRLSQCELSRDGDPKLLDFNGGYESVFGADKQFQVIYLREPAPPGSYTAYRAHAPAGLSAGYHVRPAHVAWQLDAPESCKTGQWADAALTEVNAQYGTHYDYLATHIDENGSEQTAPREVVDSYLRISARLEMEACPITSFVDSADSSEDIRIEIEKTRTYWAQDPPWLAKPKP